MKIHEKYLEAIKTFDDFATILEWAVKVGELYPELLDKANKEAEKHKNKTTGLREIAARIGSWVSTGDFDKFLKIDTSESPRKVKYITPEEFEENTSHEIEEDLAPLNRKEIEKKAEDSFGLKELYRYDELKNIQKAFKTFFNLDFEIDHAKALLNEEEKGEHHPDNFQLILKYHNVKKNNQNWKRFSLDEQREYIKQTVKLHNLVAGRLNIEIDDQLLESLLERLKSIY